MEPNQRQRSPCHPSASVAWPRLTQGWPWAAAAIAVGLISVCLASPASAYTPETPEVKAVIEQGLAFLEKNDDFQLGAKCLIALCFYKTGRPIDHPKIKSATTACQNELANLGTIDNYSLGLALVYLCELNESDQRELAQKYLAELLKRQKNHGGWGYANAQTGDTSQTQYAALGMWMAANHGHEVPQEAVEKLCGWLLRTQDPDGTWAYQGTDPGAFTRIKQTDVKRLSLHVAGLGSVYITADLLDVTHSEAPPLERRLPPALRPVGSEDDAAGGKRGKIKVKTIDPQFIRRSMSEGNQYYAANYKIDVPEWLHYYLYGLERYQSYKELAERKPVPEPKWYNDGFEHLQKTQEADGSWKVITGSKVVATAFAVLFLARSSRKSIGNVVGDLGDGVLLGGLGLPPNTADLVERDGKIVETPLAGSIEELLAVIESSNRPELDVLGSSTPVMVLDSDVTKRAGQITRLRNFVAAGPFDARMIAVKTLSRARDLDNVPVLIYALGDVDPRIVREADKGLRFISRKFGGYGLTDKPQKDEILAVTKAWKEWYKSVRPEAEFLD